GSGGGQVPVTPAVAPLLLVPGIEANGGFGAVPPTPGGAPFTFLPGPSAAGAFSGVPLSLPPVTLRFE
ncbi:MAG TPA: hypothetical protein PKE47_12130, partial [Verrucomicrobiota bacterium]|nr:hypothetical protein [Verrucomicrobiota bacterium]